MDYADLNGCIPICEVHDFFGDYYTTVTTGIGPGQTLTYEVEFIATSVVWPTGQS